MRITINKADGLVGVDGVFRRIDLSALDPLIRVIQFDTDKGAGHIEFSDDATIEVLERDVDAEAAALEAAGDDRAAIDALRPIYRAVRVRRENESLASFDAYVGYLDLWRAASQAQQPTTFEPRGVPRKQWR